MKRTVLLAVAIPVVTGALAGVPLRAQNEASASLSVRVPTAKASYFVGEEVPIDLEFRGTAPPDYYFSTAQCGWFMRLETVAAMPAQGVDDVSELLRSSMGGGGGSCPSGWHPLDATPFTVHFELNDFLRFRQPGTYRVVVTSTRLQRYSRLAAPVLTSAPMQVTIVPADPSWAREEANRARALIARGGSDDVRQGARMLQYLGTEAAATALADDYDAIAGIDASATRAGLVLSPYRARAIAAMDARVDRGLSLHPTFISTLAWLRVLEEMSTQSDARLRGERARTIEAEYEARWRNAVARRPPSAATLAAELQRLQSNPNRGLADDLDAHPAEAAAAFAALPVSDQQSLLQADVTWQYINRPWIDAALEQSYAGWRGTANQNAFAGAGDLVLSRLYERNPDVGRTLILEEIRTGAHQVRYDALALLPDAQFPELDASLQSRYASPPTTDRLNDRGTTAWLMARYGSDGLRPWVSRTMAEPLPSCMVEAGLLAYLFKHDVPAAMARLDPTRTRTAADGCVTPPFEQLAPRYWDASVEGVVIRQLTSSEIDNVRVAAQVLGRYGSAAARQPLLDRLTSWSNEWRGRAADLVPTGPRAGTSPDIIENALTNALFENPRFALTKDDGSRIAALCVTDACRTNVGARSRLLR